MYQRVKSVTGNNGTTRSVGVFLELEGSRDDTCPGQRNQLAADALRALAERIERMNAITDVVDIDKLGLFYGNMLSISLPLLSDAAVVQGHRMTLRAWQHQWAVAYGEITPTPEGSPDPGVIVKMQSGHPAFPFLYKLTDYTVAAVHREEVRLVSSL